VFSARIYASCLSVGKVYYTLQDHDRICYKPNCIHGSREYLSVRKFIHSVYDVEPLLTLMRRFLCLITGGFGGILPNQRIALTSLALL
jgi:hypothetical protein